MLGTLIRMITRRTLLRSTAAVAAVGAAGWWSYRWWTSASYNTELEAALSSYFDPLAAADVFSGAVHISKNGHVLFERAYGLADRATGLPNRTDTKFNLGSMNKMFTAVAVGQLVEQGKLTFDDTVAHWLPDRAIDGADRITLHHLLTHTSDMGDFFGPRFFSGGKDLLNTLWDYFPLFESTPLAFEPGARWSYSNAGFIVLGAIVERASDEDYFDYVRGHLLRPSGMHDTDSYARDEQVPNLATGYTRFGPRGIEAGSPRPNIDTLPARGAQLAAVTRPRVTCSGSPTRYLATNSSALR
jgi:CubicO group peptidase (beta-lactamase class C family)